MFNCFNPSTSILIIVYSMIECSCRLIICCCTIIIWYIIIHNWTCHGRSIKRLPNKLCPLSFIFSCYCFLIIIKIIMRKNIYIVWTSDFYSKNIWLNLLIFIINLKTDFFFKYEQRISVYSKHRFRLINYLFKRIFYIYVIFMYFWIYFSILKTSSIIYIV